MTNGLQLSLFSSSVKVVVATHSKQRASEAQRDFELIIVHNSLKIIIL